MKVKDKSLVTRDQRLLQRALVFCVDLANMDEDAGHEDKLLMRLLRDAHEAGYSGLGGQNLAELADKVESRAKQCSWYEEDVSESPEQK